MPRKSPPSIRASSQDTCLTQPCLVRLALPSFAHHPWTLDTPLRNAPQLHCSLTAYPRPQCGGKLGRCLHARGPFLCSLRSGHPHGDPVAVPQVHPESCHSSNAAALPDIAGAAHGPSQVVRRPPASAPCMPISVPSICPRRLPSFMCQYHVKRGHQLCLDLPPSPNPGFSLQFVSLGRIKVHQADLHFARLPEIVRPSLYVPKMPRPEL